MRNAASRSSAQQYENYELEHLSAKNAALVLPGLTSKDAGHGDKLHLAGKISLGKKLQNQRLLPGVHCGCLLGQDPCAAGFRIDDLHVVPIVGKFFATTQADKVGSGDGRDNRTRLAFAASNKWRAFFMATAKNLGPGQFEQFNKHKTPHEWGPARVERTKPQERTIRDGEFPDLNHGPCFLASH